MTATPETRADGPARARPVPAAPRVQPLPEGPLLVEGPVDVVLPDGTVQRCDRPVVAFCTCRRSLRAPFCDTSHRPRLRAGRSPRAEKAKDAPDTRNPQAATAADMPSTAPTTGAAAAEPEADPS